MNNYIIGIDLGGMSAKGGLFTHSGELLCTDKCATNRADGFEGTVQKLADLAKTLTEQQGGFHLQDSTQAHHLLQAMFLLCTQKQHLLIHLMEH